MSSARRRPLAAASFAVVMTLTLGACGTSFSAQTNQQYQPGVGSNARGDVDTMNTLLVANAGGTATVSTSLQNNLKKDQSLSSVTVTTLDDEKLQVTAPDEQLSLAPGRLVDLGEADPAGVFIVDDERVMPGLYVKVTFTFSNSSPVTLEAPIVDRTSEYADVVEAPETGAATEKGDPSEDTNPEGTTTEDTTSEDGQ